MPDNFSILINNFNMGCKQDLFAGKIRKGYCSTSQQKYSYRNPKKYLSASSLEMKYSIVVHKDSQSDYSVSIPDLPGCFSAGSTVEEAYAMAKEAIECHIEGMLLDGEAIPSSHSIEKHQSNPVYRDGVWGLIDIDLSKLSLKSKRINITLPEYLLNTVDVYAKKHGETRSGLLAHAVNEYMNSHQ